MFQMAPAIFGWNKWSKSNTSGCRRNMGSKQGEQSYYVGLMQDLNGANMPLQYLNIL